MTHCLVDRSNANLRIAIYNIIESVSVKILILNGKLKRGDMVKKFINKGYKKISRFSIAALLVISGSGVAPLLFSSTAHANILGPVNGIFINEFGSYGDDDWIELQNKNGNTVSLKGLSIRFIDPTTEQLNLDGYILGDGFIKLNVGNKLNRTGGAFSLSNGSKSQLINYGNTSNIGFKVTGAPGDGQVSARFEYYNGQSWKITSAATPGKHNNPTVPTPTIISPVNEAVQQSNNVTFAWQPIDRAFMYSISLSSEPNFLQPTPLSTASTSYPWNDTELMSSLEEGTYYWRIHAHRDGKWGPWSEVHKFTVDKAAPTVTFTQPSPDEGSYINNDFDVTLTAHDSSKLDSATVSLLNDSSQNLDGRWEAGCSYGDLDVSDLTQTCRIVLPAELPDGTYTIQIDSQDQAGINAVSQSRSIHIDRTKPEASTLIEPSNNLVTRGYSIAHTWSESSSTDVDHYILERYDNAEGTSKLSSEKISSTSINSTYTEDVTYWWRVRAVDRASNESDWSELRKVTLDNTAPTFRGETNYSMLTGKKLTLAPTVDEENVTYQWTLGDSKKNILTNRNSSLTDPTLTIGNLPKGDYSVTLIITDQVGNATDPIKYHISVNTPSFYRHIVDLILAN